MTTFTDKHIDAFENFEILPPVHTGSTDDTIKVPEGRDKTVPFELEYPGISKDIPDVNRVNVWFFVGQIGVVFELTAEEALTPQTLKTDVQTIAFGGRVPKTLRVFASVHVWVSGSETLSARSADRLYKVTFE